MTERRAASGRFGDARPTTRAPHASKAAAQHTTPSIAVVVPNRNDARYIPRCLHSVFDQQVPADELIVVDDQSTDDSVVVIRGLIAGRPAARLVECSVNLGTMNALNEGLRRARSDYVVFLASNDYVVPGLFARAKACLSGPIPPGLWSAMVWTVDEHDRLLRLHPSAVVALRDAVLAPERCVRLAHRLGNWFTGTTVVYRRDALQAIGGFDLAYKGLSDLIAALTVASIHGAAFSPEPLGVMREHTGGYLARTLADLPALETMFTRLRERGPAVSARLFSGSFLARLEHRFRFAGLRASRATRIAEIAARTPNWRGSALRLVDRSVPVSLPRARSALAYAVLRPYDVLPALWYRFAKVLLVRLRLRFRRRPVSVS